MQYSNLESILIKNSQTGFYISTPEGLLKDCNDSFVKMFGYDSKEDVLQHNTSVFYFDKNERKRFLDELHSKNHTQGFAIKAKTKSGKTIHISINSDLYVEKDGQQLIVGSIIDVTEVVESKSVIAEGEKKYKDFIENSPEIIQSFNSEGKLLFCNSVWHQKLEYSKEEVENMNLFDIIADEYKEHCSMMFQEVLSGKALKDVAVEFVSKSGKRYILEGNVVPLVEKGKMVATHAFFRDVSEKKRTMDKIIEQEKILQTVFNTVPICLYIKDSSGQYLHANDIMQKTLRSDVIKHNDVELFPTTCALPLKDTDKQALKNPDSIVKFEMDVDFGKQTRHFLCGKKAIYNQAKNNYDLFGFSVDISDFKNAAAEVEKKEKLLLSIINNTRGGFILFKLDNEKKHFISEYSNDFAKKLLQLTYNQVEFNDVFHFLDKDFKNKISVENLCNSDNFLETIDWKYTLPGTEIEKVYSLRFSTIKISTNEVKVIAFIIDITDEKKLIEQLELKLKENDVLIGEVHHRVKNNLAIIDGIIELKKSRVADPLMNDNLTDIQMRIKSIALVHQKLYQSGNFSAINLYDYINELGNHYKRLFDSNNTKQIHFEVVVNKNETLSLSKSISFGLLLSELISNSCKYAIINNQITIGVSINKHTDGYVMNYTDSGNGLPENLKNFKNGGFGFRLIDNFIKQLKGKGSFPESKHFNFELEFTT